MTIGQALEMFSPGCRDLALYRSLIQSYELPREIKVVDYRPSTKNDLWIYTGWPFDEDVGSMKKTPDGLYKFVCGLDGGSGRFCPARVLIVKLVKYDNFSLED